MTRCLGACFLGSVLLVGSFLDLAWGQERPDDFRRSMGNLRPDSRTAAAAIQGSPPPRSTPEPLPPETAPAPDHGGGRRHPGRGHGGVRFPVP